MPDFPRTTVGGVSVSRMIIGTNWFLGFSHQTTAKDKFIQEFQTCENIADILTVFFENGIDTILGMPEPILTDAISIAQDRTGRKGILVLTPSFELTKDGPKPGSAEKAFDEAKELGATFCFPHTSVTDPLIDQMRSEIRHYDDLSKLIREREMIPGLSPHLPEAIPIADSTNADVESYTQLYNAIDFLMHLEVDWVMRLIKNAKKPVMTIKPLAAGKLDPAVGLAFSWNTIRDQDMVTIGTTTPDEAKEVIELSRGYLAKRLPENKLQQTRSKKTLKQ